MEWLAPGRKVIEGYLLVVRGPRKRDYGLFGNLVADAIEETKPGSVPRYQDTHGVWFGYDPEGPERNRHREPFVRYKAFRPIDGLRRECNHHRVRLTCTITKQWSNGLGAYIVRAKGECLTCDEEAKAEADAEMEFFD